MPLPRVQLFEFGDLSVLGRDVPETLIEALGRTQRWGRMLRGLAPPFRAFLDEARVDTVVDLASGAGGPAAVLVEELRRAGGVPPRVILTDLRPRPAHWDRAVRSDPALSFHPRSVDATALPAALSEGRARLLVNAFHHFPPQTARAVLADAVRSGAPLFVSEAFGRNPLGFAPFGPVGLPALFATPVLTPRPTALKVLFAWGLAPAALALAIWDGLVSTLRQYTRDELREMALSAVDGFRWTYGRWRYPFGGRGWYLGGVPAPGPASWREV